MRVRPRIALLAAALGLTVTAGGRRHAVRRRRGADLRRLATIEVQGTLVVAESDGPAGGSTSYAVALADGDLVPVRGQFPPDARTGATFSGRLALPASVASAASSVSAALRIVDRRSLSLSVVGTPSVTAVAPSVAPVAHRQFVAAVDNKGALGQTNATLLAHVSTVGTYWKSESNGAITGLTPPTTVTHYNTALTTTDCGLGGDFFTVIEEAEAKFPGINPFGGPDQLVLFVPDACASGGVVGEGSVGSSFASGGVLIVKAECRDRRDLRPRDRAQLRLRARLRTLVGHGTGVLRRLRRDGLRGERRPRRRELQPADRAQHAVAGLPGDHRRRRDPGRRPRGQDAARARHGDHQAAHRRARGCAASASSTRTRARPSTSTTARVAAATSVPSTPFPAGSTPLPGCSPRAWCSTRQES